MRRTLFPPLNKGNRRDKAPLTQKALISCLFRTLVGVFTSLHRTKIMAKILVTFDTVDEGFEKIGAERYAALPQRAYQCAGYAELQAVSVVAKKIPYGDSPRPQTK